MQNEDIEVMYGGPVVYITGHGHVPALLPREWDRAVGECVLPESRRRYQQVGINSGAPVSGLDIQDDQLWDFRGMGGGQIVAIRYRVGMEAEYWDGRTRWSMLPY